MEGAKYRETNQVATHAVEFTDKQALKGFVSDRADSQATGYTDDAGAYGTLSFEHEAVNHSVSECVPGKTHTNGVGSIGSMLKRVYLGTHRRMSQRHLQRHINEFSNRHKMCRAGTFDPMEVTMLRMIGKQLPFKNLKKANSLDSGARGIAA